MLAGRLPFGFLRELHLGDSKWKFVQVGYPLDTHRRVYVCVCVCVCVCARAFMRVFVCLCVCV